MKDRHLQLPVPLEQFELSSLALVEYPQQNVEVTSLQTAEAPVLLILFKQPVKGSHHALWM